VAPQKPIEEAPGPRGLGLVRTLRRLQKDPLGAFSRAAEEFGPVVKLSRVLGSRALYLVHEPEHVRAVLGDQTGRYSKETESYSELRRIVGRGILTADGDAWRGQRRLVTPCLNASRNRTLLDATRQLTGELALRWQRAAEQRESLDLRGEMVWLTLSILAQAVFQADARSTAGEVGRALDCVLGEADGRFEDALGRLDDEVVRIKRESKGRCPFHRKVAPPASERDVLLTLVLAGHETTASTLAFALSLLAAHPDAAERVRSEALAEHRAQTPLRERVPRLATARAVIHETLRLYPPVWLVERRAECAGELGEYAVSPGTTFAVCLYLAQRKASAWPDPDRFIPERFLAEGARRELLAFGVGPRGCAGAGFAVDEMTLALAELTRCFRLEVTEPIELRAGVTLRTKSPVFARVSSLGAP
jgi:cytochrome P450